MIVKFDSKDWKALARVKAEGATDLYIAFYKRCATKAGFSNKFMIALGKKYNPSGFCIGVPFSRKLDKLITKRFGHHNGWEILNASPGGKESLSPDEVLVLEDKCFS
jgi:hypothetical protein